jgi:type II secretory pathway pseudopilin PulG
MRAGERAGPGARRQLGFTYLGLLALVVLIGILLAAAGEVARTSAQRESETELLFIGHQYRDAIGRYFARTHRYPQTLEELVGVTNGATGASGAGAADPVGGALANRYLRRLYPDPMTGAVDWTLLPAPGGGIMGVASASARPPLKRAGFDDVDAGFDTAETYAGWSFVYDPRFRPGVLLPGTAPPPTR